jgi:hypothetical protein
MSSSKIEQYPYEVIKKYNGFEIRKYEASLFTSVRMNTDEYKKASGSGFSILAGYIFGGNKSKEKIAMTSPVAMTLEDSMTVMFMVPKAYELENLPEPDNKNIQFKTEPEKTVAAITFGGWASNEKIETYKEKLISLLESENINHTNQFYFLGYNPPYEMINRKNEIIVELEEPGDSKS